MHKKVEQHYREQDDVVSFHLQTVWEAQDTNTPKRGLAEMRRHGIKSAVGFDAHVDGARLSSFMKAFATRGTPWTIVIDRSGVVRYNSVTPSSHDRLVELVDRLLAEKVQRSK